MTFGIIGTNFISDSFAMALSAVGGKATAVYSRKRETGEAFAKKHGIPFVFDDLTAFFASDAFKTVYIASPNCAHKEQALSALAHGKHVLCEKPIAPSLAEFLQMQEAAKKEGLVLMEAMRPYHDSLWKDIRDRLPLLGKVRGGHLEFCQYSSRYDRFLAGEYTNTFDPSLSNAALLDIGIYPIAVAVWLFGAPRGVCGKSVFLDGGFEGAGAAVLHYGTHTLSVSYSKISDSLTPSSVLGEWGGLTIDKLSQPTKAVFRLRTGEETVLTREHETPFGNMRDEILAFRRAIEENNTAPLWEQTENALAVCDALRKASGIRFPSDEEDGTQ